MARFRIKKDNLPGLVWLVDFAFVGSRRESCLAVEQACELRDLLNKEFPVEPARAEHVLTEERCPDERADRGLHNGDCRRCARHIDEKCPLFAQDRDADAKLRKLEVR